MPILASKVLIMFPEYLSEREKSEILEYREVFYFGERAEKKRDESKRPYDNGEGYYQAGTPGSHIAFRYEVFELLGKGSFGQVYKCRDNKTGTLVALKMVRNQWRFRQQAMVEVRMLEAVRSQHGDSDSVVRMLDYFSFRGHVCITFELLSATLYDFMRITSFYVRCLLTHTCRACQRRTCGNSPSRSCAGCDCSRSAK